jgi:hypothetical protein
MKTRIQTQADAARRVRWRRTLTLLVGVCLGAGMSRLAAQTVVRPENFHQGIGLFGRSSFRTYIAPSNATYRPFDLQGVTAAQIVSNDVCQVYAGYDYQGLLNVAAPAVRLTTNGPVVRFVFTNLPPGVYFLRTIARVAQPTEGTLGVFRRPLYLHWKINDGLGGVTNDYRVRCNYSTNLEEVGRLFFNALYPTNNLGGELSLGPGSQNELRVHRIEFYDALAGTARRSYKTNFTTFTPAERAYERQVVAAMAAHAARDPDPIYGTYDSNPFWWWVNWNSPFLPTNLTGAARISRDDTLWNAFPPPNVMVASPGRTAPYAAPAGANGTWRLFPSATVTDYGTPLVFTNDTLRRNYTLTDYKLHRPLPGAYGDDGLGWYAPSSPAGYYFIIGELMEQRMFYQYYEALSQTVGLPNVNLPWRYHLTGNTNAAHEGALLLARFALQWPAMHFETQELSLNTTEPDKRWEERLPGKIVYYGWADAMQSYLYLAYDRLFDFLQTNQSFANTLNRYIPWIRTPGDVLTFFDTHLVQAGIVDTKTLRIRTTQPMLLGLVQGPSPIATELMDLSQVQVDQYPVGVDTMKDHYHNSLNQDGAVALGSTFYVGESLAFVDAWDPMQRYKAFGGTVPYDLTDLAAYPKVRAFCDYLLDQTVAGGFEPTAGDAAKTIYSPRGYFDFVLPRIKRVWQMTGNPKAAWLLLNVASGRTTETDAEWAAVTNAAATVRDPRLASASRVFAGFGLGILESGVASDDFRAKRAVVLRTGTGQGHAHYDALDLNVFAHGFRAANDFGQRNEGSLLTVPPDSASYTHNTVEVDGYYHHTRAGNGWPGGSFSRADAWFEAFKTNSGVQFLAGFGQSLDHTNVQAFRRDVALVDVDATNSYVFDVFRVKGGRWHTWCFHGADAGVESGGFTVNTTLSVPPAGSVSDYYLRKHATNSRREGPSRPRLEATWRLSRTASTNALNNTDGDALTVATVAAEQSIYGNDYVAASPRKYTRAVLFDRPNDTVLVGNLYSASYQINMPLLYVQSRQPGTNYAAMTEREVVYPALIEPYVGQPFITNSVSLAVSNNEADALKAVALRVQTANGNTDLLFSDGRNMPRVLTNGLMRVQGRFALCSETPAGFRLLNLVGGVELAKDGISVKPDTAVYRATIQSVDYTGRKIYTVERLPASLPPGQQFHIFNAGHHASYKIVRVADAGAGSVLTFSNPADVGDFAIESVAGDTIISDDRRALDDYANRHRGLTAVNERGTKSWKIEKLPPLDAYQNISYRLTGAPVADADFTDEDGDGRRSVIVYDFGPGDTLELPSNVWLQRNGADYLLDADTGVTLTLPGTGVMVGRSAGGAWQNITVGSGNGVVTGYVPAGRFTNGVQQVRVAAAGFDTNAPVLSGVAVLAVSDSTAWIGWDTDEPADSQVEFGLTPAYGQTTPLNAALVTAHTLLLTGLAPATTYHFRVHSRDFVGNPAASADFTLTTLERVNTAPAVSAGPDQTVSNAVVTLAGTVSDDGLPDPPGRVTVSWNLVAGPAGVSFSAPGALTTAVYFSLEGSYRFQLLASDGALTASDEVNVTVVGPLISAVAVESVTSSNAVIVWNTSSPSDSQVEYGLTPAYGQATVRDAALGTAHRVTVTNVVSGTLYHFRVRSRNAAGSTAVSADATFATVAVAQEPRIYVPFYAESGALVSPMGVFNDPFDATRRMVMSTKSSRGTATYTFYVPHPDDYVIWCRVLAPSSNQDSFYVAVDGGVEQVYHVAEGSWVNAWKWTRVNSSTSGNGPFPTRRFSFGVGNHTVVFRGREQNTGLSRLILTNDPDFTPQDNQPVGGVGTAVTVSNLIVKLTLNRGLSVIANQLHRGGNTVADVIPTAPDGTQLMKFDAPTGAFHTNTFQGGAWTNPAETLAPGEGAFLYNASSGPTALGFTGRLQVNNPPRQLAEGFHLLSGLYPRTGRLSEVLEFPPTEGDAVYRYENLTGMYSVHYFTAGAWENEPVIGAGESFYLFVGPR